MGTVLSVASVGAKGWQKAKFGCLACLCYLTRFCFQNEVDFKGSLKSESTGRFSNSPKNVPRTILNYYIQYMAMIKY